MTSKKWLALALAIVITTTSLEANANALTFLKNLIQGADDVARLGKHTDDAARLGKYGDDAAVLGGTGDDITSFGMRYSDEAFIGMDRSEVNDIASALSRMRTHSGKFYDENVAVIRSMLQKSETSPKDLQRSIQLSAHYPNIKIRVPGDTKFDRAFRSFSLARYQETLATKFDVEDLRVVTVGLSDDAALSASEAARFRRTLGRHIYDEVGPLARIESGAYTTVEQFKRALTPYRGKTIVVVGHVPNDLKGFFVFRNGVREKLDIEKIMRAAKEADVNLVPIGCNSNELAELGVEGVINSGDVLKRLSSVITAEPKTIGNFFKELSSEDLTLVIDPLSLKVVSNQAEIIVRQRNRTIGRVYFEIARQTPSWMRSWKDSWISISEELEIENRIADHDFCFTASPTMGEYDDCLVKKAAERKHEEKISFAKYRQEQRNIIPKKIAETEEKQNKTYFILSFLILIHTFFFFLMPIVFFTGFTVAKWDEEERGLSFRRAISPTAFKETVFVVLNALRHPIECWVLILTAICALAFTGLIGIGLPAYLADELSYGHEGLVEIALIIGCALAGKMVLSFLWEAIKESSIALFISSLAPLPLLLSAYLLGITFEHQKDLTSNMDRMGSEIVDLERNRESDLQLLSLKTDPD